MVEMWDCGDCPYKQDAQRVAELTDHRDQAVDVAVRQDRRIGALIDQLRVVEAEVEAGRAVIAALTKAVEHYAQPTLMPVEGEEDLTYLIRPHDPLVAQAALASRPAAPGGALAAREGPVLPAPPPQQREA